MSRNIFNLYIDDKHTTFVMLECDVVSMQMQRLRSRIQTKSEPFIQAWKPIGNKQKWKNMRVSSSTDARKKKEAGSTKA